MRSYRHLSEDERDQIGIWRAAGRSAGAIARALGRAKATISRELQRNALPSGGYGTSAFPASEIGARKWRPADGAMSLPLASHWPQAVLTLEEAAFLHNRDLMLTYARAAGVEIAPHAKTPMAPDLALSLIEAGELNAREERRAPSR